MGKKMEAFMKLLPVMFLIASMVHGIEGNYERSNNDVLWAIAIFLLTK